MVEDRSVTKFYVYVDWTTEDPPRPFYVGKGKLERVRNLERNDMHTHVAEKHGQDRKIIAEFFDEQAALDLETKMRFELHTWVFDPEYNGIGCDMCAFGCLQTGQKRSAETRALQSRRKREGEFVPWNKGKTGVISDETRAKLSAARSGTKASDETRKKLSESSCMHDPEIARKQAAARVGKHYPALSEALKGEKNGMFGRHHSPESAKKISDKAKSRDHRVFELIGLKQRGKKKSCRYCGEVGHNVRKCEKLRNDKLAHDK